MPQGNPPTPLDTVARRVWAFLVLLGIVAGALAGYAFFGHGPIKPFTGVLACLGIVGLMITMLAWEKNQAR